MIEINHDLEKKILDDFFLKHQEQQEERNRILADNEKLYSENKKMISENANLQQTVLQLEQELQRIYASKSYRVFHNRVTRFLGRCLRRSHNQDIAMVNEDKIILTPSIEQCKREPELGAKISVIVPTYNGADTLIRQFGLLSTQLGIADVELIMVDSGSTDETIEIGKLFGARVIQITQEEFSHSYARNLGAKNATGDYLLFMTQDAIPTDEYWLYRLFAPIIQGHVVAVSPMELETSQGDMKYKIDIESHMRFLGVFEQDKIGSMPDKQDYYNMRVNAQLCDVTCLIKKDVFLKYGYHGSFAEDLDLGLKLIRDGYTIGLVASTRVLHSHNRSALYNLKRCYVDVKRIKELLTDFPMVERSEKQLIDEIAEEYMYINTFINSMCNKFEEKALDEYIIMVNDVLKQALVVEDKKVMDGIYDQQLDEILDSIIPSLVYDKNTGKKIEMPQELAQYFEYSVIPYLRTRYDRIDIELNKQIMEAFYKTFASFTGVKIAEYNYYSTKNDAIKMMARKLSGGV